jgi:hypothetical protein
VTFPSGVTRTEPGYDNVCETCHRGREAKATVDAGDRSGQADVQERALPARPGASSSARRRTSATSTTARPTSDRCRTSAGRSARPATIPKASHHTFRIEDSWDGTCRVCHADANGDPQKIRLIRTVDYDGDGNATEPLAAEIDGLAARTLAAMQAVAPAPGLCYTPDTYPYFFKDTNGDKNCSAAEAVASNGFAAWTAGLAKAAFNYQLSRKEPGAWAHNFDYMAQLLYDSTADLGGDVSKLRRP